MSEHENGWAPQLNAQPSSHGRFDHIVHQQPIFTSPSDMEYKQRRIQARSISAPGQITDSSQTVRAVEEGSFEEDELGFYEKVGCPILQALCE
uniref:Uncharacterized protein n=1 Tax=Kwoniella bestiolae CBS 10118 TaxID=1296100 RepID=A0A1B9FWB4_9TREE|nr:hypothetical protein I302_07415 [Kwoniella bestiolae CBS 10118]OCF23064.1 hypothetical protein I302_07415 [Kwoniella bestiolae CBS 10118]